MSLYAVGDIQGCHAELCELLDSIGFAPQRDRLWIVGDVVNRGPDSLAALREVKALGCAAVTVLGNHDLHLLTVAHGHRRLHRGDTLRPILDAPDRVDLLDWLHHLPLVVQEEERVLVHAGLLPQWAAPQSVALSREVEAILGSPRASDFLAHLYGDEPANWRDDLDGFDRLRVIVNACTRLRFCRADGTMDFREKRGADHAPAGMKPWYAHAHRRTADVHVVCGHWSTLGLLLLPNVSMLDTGCVWGGPLTAMRLPDGKIYQVRSRSGITPTPSE